jgi:hypothetical protein
MFAQIVRIGSPRECLRDLQLPGDARIDARNASFVAIFTQSVRARLSVFSDDSTNDAPVQVSTRVRTDFCHITARFAGHSLQNPGLVWPITSLARSSSSRLSCVIPLFFRRDLVLGTLVEYSSPCCWELRERRAVMKAAVKSRRPCWPFCCRSRSSLFGFAHWPGKVDSFGRASCTEATILPCHLMTQFCGSSIRLRNTLNERDVASSSRRV